MTPFQDFIACIAVVSLIIGLLNLLFWWIDKKEKDQ